VHSLVVAYEFQHIDGLPTITSTTKEAAGPEARVVSLVSVSWPEDFPVIDPLSGLAPDLWNALDTLTVNKEWLRPVSWDLESKHLVVSGLSGGRLLIVELRDGTPLSRCPHQIVSPPSGLGAEFMDVASVYGERSLLVWNDTCDKFLTMPLDLLPDPPL